MNLQKTETSPKEGINPLFLADEKELKAFAQKVDDWKARKLVSGVTIDVSSTSTVLKSVGIPANKITVSQLVLEKMNSPENVIINKSHGHYLDIDIIKNIPNYLANPVMVFNSESRPGSYVIMTETVDSKNQTVMVALGVNKIDANIVVNNITSAYGREENEWFIEQIKLGNLIYQDKKRSLEWTNERGLSLPTQMSTQGSLNVIQKEDIVNKRTSNFSINDRKVEFTENQQEFLKSIGFKNSVNSDGKLNKSSFYKEDSKNEKIYLNVKHLGNNDTTIFLKKNNTDYPIFDNTKKNFFEFSLISIANSEERNFIPLQNLGEVLSDYTLERLVSVEDSQMNDKFKDKPDSIFVDDDFKNQIDNISFKNKVSNLPAKFISEDIYSSGINPIGKELTFKVYKEVLKSASVPVEDKKHYLLKIQTDNNYEYVHNKDSPRLYEAKWDRKSQSYTDVVELDLSNFDSKTIGNIQYIAANNCDYHLNQITKTNEKEKENMDKIMDKEIERIQANYGLSDAEIEADIKARENPKPDYLDDKGNPHWYDEEEDKEEYDNGQIPLEVVDRFSWCYFNSDKVSTHEYIIRIDEGLFKELAPEKYKETSFSNDEIPAITYRQSTNSNSPDQFLISKYHINKYHQPLIQKTIDLNDNELLRQIKLNVDDFEKSEKQFDKLNLADTQYFNDYLKNNNLETDFDQKSQTFKPIAVFECKGENEHRFYIANEITQKHNGNISYGTHLFNENGLNSGHYELINTEHDAIKDAYKRAENFCKEWNSKITEKIDVVNTENKKVEYNNSNISKEDTLKKEEIINDLINFAAGTKRNNSYWYEQDELFAEFDQEWQALPCDPEGANSEQMKEQDKLLDKYANKIIKVEDNYKDYKEQYKNIENENAFLKQQIKQFSNNVISTIENKEGKEKAFLIQFKEMTKDLSEEQKASLFDRAIKNIKTDIENIKQNENTNINEIENEKGRGRK